MNILAKWDKFITYFCVCVCDSRQTHSPLFDVCGQTKVRRHHCHPGFSVWLVGWYTSSARLFCLFKRACATRGTILFDYVACVYPKLGTLLAYFCVCAVSWEERLLVCEHKGIPATFLPFFASFSPSLARPHTRTHWDAFCSYAFHTQALFGCCLYGSSIMFCMYCSSLIHVCACETSISR